MFNVEVKRNEELKIINREMKKEIQGNEE